MLCNTGTLPHDLILVPIKRYRLFAQIKSFAWFATVYFAQHRLVSLHMIENDL